jgi:hypothetical protein
MTLKEIKDQIRSLLDKEMVQRIKLKNQMVGNLYPSVIQDEILQIRNWIENLDKKEE